MAFYHEISPGDIVITRRGTKRIIGIGTVIGSPFYDEQKGRERVGYLTEEAYSNFLPVKWEKKKERWNLTGLSSLIYEISEEKYQALIGEMKGAEEASDIESSAEFAIEKHLEDFIVANFERIFRGQLKLYEDEEGGIGQQYPIVGTDGKEIGYIDILAVEPSTNSYVVIELKKGRQSSDQMVGQVLRYMGWVAENLCQAGERVKGLIICKEVDEKLAYALRMVQGLIEVKRYGVDFRLID